MVSGKNDRANRAPAILIVDDDADNRRIAGAILRAGGWRVEEAEDGAGAITAVDRRGYALVLLDIQMPGLDGYATARAIRAAPGIGHAVPILAFTALRDAGAIARTRDAGMDGHVAKPFTPGELIAAVAPWYPDADYAAIDRLAVVFGPAEIDQLLARLGEQLIDALALAAESGDLRDQAHRLAGLAGTLGFPALSHAWLAVSEGDPALEPARIETRKALAELVRRQENAADG